MIGYKKEALIGIGELLDELKYSFAPSKMVVDATFYSVITGSIETRLYDKAMFSYLMFLLVVSKKDTYKFSSSTFVEIIEADIIHRMNRGLFEQKQRKNLLLQQGPVPVVVSDALNKIGKDDHIGALCNFMIFHQLDLSEMLLDKEVLTKMLQDKSVFKNSYVDFGEMKYGFDNIWTR